MKRPPSPPAYVLDDLAEPDPSVANPRVVRWERAFLLDDEHLVITGVHGAHEGLHSVTSVEDQDRVAITARIGTRRLAPPADGSQVVAIPAVGIEWAYKVKLGQPLGDRRIDRGVE